MIAKVAPIRRMPSSLGLFDYETDETDTEVKPGQLVKVPFRGSDIFGIVYDTNSESQLDNIKPISSVVHQTPVFSTKRLNFFKDLSELYNISLATQTKLGFLPLQPRKLKQIELEHLNDTDTQNSFENRFQLYRDRTQHKEIYSNLEGAGLVLVPQTRFIDEIKSLLPKKYKDNIVTWHSELNQKERFNRWLKIRNNGAELIIGTRSSVFLPFQNLDHIVIDHEHKENHKHWDQAPRFHSLDVAENLQQLHSSDITFCTYSPSCKSYFQIHKDKIEAKPDTEERITKMVEDEPNLINMKQARKAGNYGPFADVVRNKLQNTDGDSFVFINRLGYSRAIVCKECGYTAECSRCNLPYIYHKNQQRLKCHYCNINKNAPLACPECSEDVVEQRGMGTEAIEEELEDIVETEVKRIDSNIDEIELKEDEDYTIVGTEKALKYIRWERTDTIVFANIDSQLRFPEFKTSEKVWGLIQDVNYARKDDSDFFIQSINPGQLVLKSLSEPDRFYRMDLNSRKNLSYPPYKYLLRYFYGTEKESKAEQKARDLYSKLSEKLTEEYKTNIIIAEPKEMHPKYYRGSYWRMILVKLPRNNWRKELKWLNSFVDTDWKVDPNPISVLSP